MKVILIAFLAFTLVSCSTKRIYQKEYITVRDTVITPPVVNLDTTVLFKDRFIYLKDSTGQMTVTIERIKNNYIKVKAKCKPDKIIVPVTKTVTQVKKVTVQNNFYKYISLLLFFVVIIMSFYISIRRLL